MRPAQRGFHLLRQRQRLCGAPLRHDARVHQQMTFLQNCQRLPAHPVQQRLAVGCLQDVIQRIGAMHFANALRHGQQVQVVIAQYRFSTIAKSDYCAQSGKRIRSAINQIAGKYKSRIR